MNVPIKTAIALGALLGWAAAAFAGNVLVNPGFELDPSSGNQNLPGWTSYGPNVYGETGSPVHSGNNYLKVYQAFWGQVNYSGIYQDYISGPGAAYSADGWAYTLGGDALAGQNAAWLEVSFRDAGGGILALYRSRVITTNAIASGAFPTSTWIDLPITNQYDPNAYVATNTVKTLVAPPGTYFVRYQVVFQGDAANSGGSVYFDDLTLSPAGGLPYGTWNIVWSDEFNGTSLDQKTWTFDTGGTGWGNSELENYTSRPTNVFVSGGCLNIVARRENYGSQSFTSARVKSQGRASWTYGRFEWRARFPAGAGFWPALWMLGTNISSIGWPGCGEIDVVETQGYALTNAQGSLHSGSDETAIYTLPGGASMTNFHTYVLDWTTNAILWYVDGHLYQTQSSWSSSVGPYPAPFNQPFFIVMNLAVGGNYVGYPSVAAIESGSTFPGVMQVDYVRVYHQTAPLQVSSTPTNGGVLLTWPSNIVCHLQAQYNPALGDSSNWVDLATSGNSAFAPTTSSVAFYRLESP